MKKRQLLNPNLYLSLGGFILTIGFIEIIFPNSKLFFLVPIYLMLEESLNLYYSVFEEGGDKNA